MAKKLVSALGSLGIFLLLIGVGTRPMPVSADTQTITYLQSASSFIDGSVKTPSMSLSFNAPNVPGDLLVATAYWFNHDNSSNATVSDSAGNSWKVGLARTPDPNSPSDQLGSWYVAKANGGANKVTISFATDHPSIILLIISEYSGADQTAPLDGTAYGAGAGSPLKANITTTKTNDLLYGFTQAQFGGLTSGSGFTQRRDGGDGFMIEDKIVSNPGSYSIGANSSQPSSKLWYVVGMAFAPAQAVPPPVVPPPPTGTAGIKVISQSAAPGNAAVPSTWSFVYPSVDPCSVGSCSGSGSISYSNLPAGPYTIIPGPSPAGYSGAVITPANSLPASSNNTITFTISWQPSSVTPLPPPSSPNPNPPGTPPPGTPPPGTPNPNPTPTPGGSLVITINSPGLPVAGVPLPATCSGGSGSYQWSATPSGSFTSFGTTSGDSSQIAATFPAPGTYTLICTDTTDRATTSKTVTVNPGCSISASPNVIVVPAGSTLNWSCVPNTAVDNSCSVTNVGGNLPTDGSSQVFPTVDPSIYSVTCVANNGLGSLIPTASTTVTVHNPVLIETNPGNGN